MLLPVVKREVAFSLEHETSHSSWKDDTLKRLQTENPIICELLSRLLEEELPPQESVLLSGLLVYRFLESQAECNKLVELIG